MALCILVESIRLAGWMDLLAVWIVNHIPPNLLVIYLFILSLSGLASAFIDNVPYVLAMIPVVQQVADNAQFPLPLLIFALLIGSCLGGNIIPIGAAANIAAISFLEKNGYTITFPSYLRYGVLFTVFALIPTSLALWMVWAEY
jgi:Na+/H+ antiporter NhaD/arsenite permease-like protein